MGTIRSSVGLASGFDIKGTVDALMQFSRRPIARLEKRAEVLTAVETAFKTLETNLFTLTASAQALSSETTFRSLNVNNSDTTQLNVDPGSGADPGTHQFQVLQLANTHQLQSKGFADPNQQTIGAGSITIATGGRLNPSTLLDAFNDGNGIRRGTIRIQDRAGNTADVDLSGAYTVDDVLEAINGAQGVSVTARADGTRLQLTDTSGGSSSDLSVSDVGGGFAALDLGIRNSVAAATLSGEDVYALSGSFTLDQLNDGNGLSLLKGAPDIRITLTDDTQIDVNLDSASNLEAVIDSINNHEDNSGKLLAEISGGRIVLTDQSGGGGTSAFAVEDINGSFAVEALGLDQAASGGTITGDALLAGMNSVLLRNLRGGQGIDELGSIQLTDRTGTTATVDLSTATSLDDVLRAINDATSDASVKLQLSASVNEARTGIEIRDTSGSTANNLVIADVGSGTLATQLGIAVDDAVDDVASGSLSHRYVNESTSLADFAPDGEGVATGGILIVDSSGAEAIVDVNSSVQTVGDLLNRINGASAISVRAELNAKGDGIVLIDEAGGSDPLRVDEVSGGTTAADLRLLGEGVLSGGEYRLESRQTAVIDVEADDTLEDIVEKLNQFSGVVSASIFDDGSAFNSTRLRLTAAESGDGGRLLVDDGGLDLGLSVAAQGRDALLRIGGDPSTGFVVASSDNEFEDVLPDVDVTALSVGATPATVELERNPEKIKGAVKALVKNYNKYVDFATELSKFDPETNERGILQGEGILLRVSLRLEGLATRRLFGSEETFRSLVDVGVRLGEGGKLVFNESVFDDAVAADPEGVEKFFLDEENGFSAKFQETIDSLTDPFTGAFSLETTAVQQSIESINERIESLDALLARKRERLLRQFARQEEIISQLQTAQSQIASIAPVGGGIPTGGL